MYSESRPSGSSSSGERGHFGGNYQRRGGPGATRRFAHWGLYNYDHKAQRAFYIPLKSVSINAKLRDFCGEVEVVQEYINKEEDPIEVTYSFPIAPNSAVYSFSAEINGKKITAELKENEEAQNAYDDAISSGHGAFSGQQHPTHNVFTAVLGNLPPGGAATIHLKYVSELRLERGKKGKTRDRVQLPGEKIKFLLPSRLAPRLRKKHSDFYDKAPSRAEFKLSIKVDVEMSSRITGISASHAVGFSFHPNSSTSGRVILSPMVHALKYDFVLLVGVARPTTFRSYALVEAPRSSEDKEFAAVLTVFLRDLLASGKAAASTSGSAKPEEKPTAEAASKEPAAEAKSEQKPAAEHAEGDDHADDDEDDDEEEDAEHEGEEEREKEEKPQASAATTKRPRVSVTDLTVEWGDGAGGIKHTPLPPTISAGRAALLVYSTIPRELAKGAEGAPAVVHATVRGKTDGKNLTVTVPVDLSTAHSWGGTLHRLYARSVIRALERMEGLPESEVKGQMLDLGKKYSIASKYTTFVGIEERTEATEGTMQSRVLNLNGFGMRRGGGRGRGEGRGRGGRGGGRGGRGGYDSYSSRDRSGDNRDYRYAGQERSHDRDEGGGGRRGYNRGDGDREQGYDSHHGGNRQYYQHDRRGGDEGGRSWKDAPQREDRGGGRGGSRRPKLDINEDLLRQLLALKKADQPYWMLNSGLSALVKRELTALTDGLVGVPVTPATSNMWATALVLAIGESAGGKAPEGWKEAVAAAGQWLSKEAEKQVIDDRATWVAKAKRFLFE